MTLSDWQRCDGDNRRDLFRVGGLTALGLGLGDFFRLQRVAAANGGLATGSAKARGYRFGEW